MRNASSLCQGAVAGFAATGPMTIFMDLVHAALPLDEQAPLPPREITERAAEQAGIRHQLSEDERQGLSMLAHFAFGTAAGALYGPLAQAYRWPPVRGGIAYGLSVWAGNYLGILPATELYRSPQHESAGRHLMMIGAHVVWGTVLGLVTKSLMHDRDSATEDPAVAERGR